MYFAKKYVYMYDTLLMLDFFVCTVYKGNTHYLKESFYILIPDDKYVTFAFLTAIVSWSKFCASKKQVYV